MSSRPGGSADAGRLREEALRLLDARGAILETARDLSDLLARAGVTAAVVGGVAVVLHGHVRTTIDVDVLVEPPLDRVAEVLLAHGFRCDPGRKEFLRGAVPVHLVLPDQTGVGPADGETIDQVRTVPLARLIEMKLRSGSRSVLRAQDLADVIGLIRAHRLTGAFAKELPNELRPEFRKLVRAIQRESCPSDPAG